MRWLFTRPIDSRLPMVISVGTGCHSLIFRALRSVAKVLRLGIVTTFSACLTCQDEGHEQLPDLHSPENSGVVQLAIAQSRQHDLLRELNETDVDVLLPLVIPPAYTSAAVQTLAERSFGVQFVTPTRGVGLKWFLRSLRRETVRQKTALNKMELVEMSEEVGPSLPQSTDAKNILIVSMLRAPDQLVIDELLENENRYRFFLGTALSNVKSTEKYGPEITVLRFRQPTSPAEVSRTLEICREFLQAREIEAVIAIPDNYWLSRFFILAARNLNKKTVFLESLKHSRSPRYLAPASQHVFALGPESAEVFAKHFGIDSSYLAVRSTPLNLPIAATNDRQVVHLSDLPKIVFLNQVRGIDLAQFKLALSELRRIAIHLGGTYEITFRHHPSETNHERSWIQGRLAGIPNLKHTFPAGQALSRDLAGARIAISFTSNALKTAAEAGLTCVAVRSGSYLESQVDPRSRYGIHLSVDAQELFETVVSLSKDPQNMAEKSELATTRRLRQSTRGLQRRREISSSTFLEELLSRD